MTKYVAFLRGINVGGNKKVSMSDLKKTFESLGFQNVRTLLNSGNVIFESEVATDKVSKKIKTVLTKKFGPALGPIKVLIMTYHQLKTVVRKAPLGFGQTPAKYYSDVVFLIDITADEAFRAFDPHPEVDAVWKGQEVIYFRRLGAKRTKSRMSKIIAKPIYKNMTIRSWNTVVKIATL